jgi:preprotein translocase subunit YajC
MQNSQQGSILGLLIPFILMFAILYFVGIRPVQKREKERRKLVESLQRGDKIMTNGGIVGNIIELKDKSIVINTAGGTKLEIMKSHILSKVNT